MIAYLENGAAYDKGLSTEDRWEAVARAVIKSWLHNKLKEDKL